MRPRLRNALRLSLRDLRLTRTIAVLVFAVALAAALSSCASSKSVRYSDADYGFSFDYPKSWTFDEAGPDASGVPPYYTKSIGAFDPKGSTGGDGITFDFISVDVYDVDPSLDPTTKDLMSDFEAYLELRKTSDSTFEIIEKPTPYTLAGLGALKGSYSFKSSDIAVRCAEYWLLHDHVIYRLFTEAGDENWMADTEVFTTFLSSFKVATTHGTPTTKAQD